MDSRLELRLSDTSPKCATCASYHEDMAQGHGECITFLIKVLDLSVCTNWTERLELEAVSK
jgi:hypothetical protein